MDSRQNSKVWSIWISRDGGSWVGFRLPFRRLQKSVSYFVFFFFGFIVMTVLWGILRYEVFRLRKDFTQAELRNQSLELKLAEFQNQKRPEEQGGKETSGSVAQPVMTFESSIFPSLAASQFNLGPLKVEKFSGDLDLARGELSVKFSVSQNPDFKGLGAESYFWLSVLHGLSGLQVFPPALGSQSGETLLSHRGEPLKVSSREKNLLARFPLYLRFREIDSSPWYLSLFIYDAKGSLVYRERTSINVQGKMGDWDWSRGESEAGSK